MPLPNLTGKYLCIVEGKGDEKIFSKLCTIADVSNVVFDSPNESHGGYGKDNFFGLLQGLPTIRGFSGANGVLILQDSDDDPELALHEIKEQLRKANEAIKNDGRAFGIPQTFLRPTFGTNTPPVVAVSIPWINEKGALESLVLSAAEKKFPELKSCVDDFVQCAGGLNGWTAGKVAKARLACIVAAKLKSNPTAAVHYVPSSQEFDSILTDSSFDQVRQMFSTLDALFGG